MGEAEISETMIRSGLGDSAERYTHDNFEATEEWQRLMEQVSKAYLHAGKGSFMYVGGQPGAGKTHICTATMMELIRRGHGSAEYVQWRKDATSLKQLITDGEAYSAKMQQITTAKILYIDDLFKTQRGKWVSQAEVNLAFEIINARYLQSDTWTIISGELSFAQMLDIDNAVGGRIVERSKNFHTDIGIDTAKDFRQK